MFSGDKSLKIMTVSGIPIKLDFSWLIIFTLISWTLSTEYYPSKFPHLPWYYAWGIGILSALFVFTSILLHELSHSIVAQRTGLPINEITLFIFGGVAQMSDDPDDANQEFYIAIAGPAMSLVLGTLFTLSWFLIKRFTGISPITSMLGYLGFINFLMIFFNMLPGLPLDGGRVLKAALWKFTGDLQKATRISSILGKTFGYLLAALGLLLLTQNIINGLWFIIIGLFLAQAAKVSYENIYLAHILKGLTVADGLTSDPVTVPGGITLEELANEYFLKRPSRGYPVVKKPHLQAETDTTGGETEEISELDAHCDTSLIEEGEEKKIDDAKVVDGDDLTGYVTLRDLTDVPVEFRPKMTVEDLVRSKKKACYCVSSETSMKDALKMMTEKKIDCLVISDNGKLTGTLTGYDISNLIAIRTALANGGGK